MELLGAMQTLFEGSLYTFVFLWTPALSPAGQRIQHGRVFACFMTARMLGSGADGPAHEARHPACTYTTLVAILPALPTLLRTKLNCARAFDHMTKYRYHHDQAIP